MNSGADKRPHGAFETDAAQIGPSCVIKPRKKNRQFIEFKRTSTEDRHVHDNSTARWWSKVQKLHQL
jgi:hypothetical protein